MRALKIESGNFCLLIKSNDEGIIKFLKDDYYHFASAKKPDLTVIFTVIEIKHGMKNKPVNLESGAKVLELTVGRYDKWYLQYLLRACFMIICSRNEALLLHSAGVVKDNKAYLFCGPAEAGKSTISSLSSEYILLSDDCLIIRKLNGSFFAYGTTLGGEYFKYRKSLKPANTGAKIRKLFFIHQAGENRIAKKDRPGALHDLLTELMVFKSGFEENDKLVDKSFDLAYSLCTKVDCYDLYFQKNAGFWNEIRKLE